MFSQFCDPANHRAQNGEAAGPLFDMGVYPINAVRNLFGAEPIEVSAFGTKHPGVCSQFNVLYFLLTYQIHTVWIL